MPTTDELTPLIEQLSGISKFLLRKEIDEIPKLLWEDETVEKMINGLYGDGVGLFVATNKKLIFIDKGLFFGLRMETLPYNKITSVEYDEGLIYGRIKISVSGKIVLVEQVNKKHAIEFADHIKTKVLEYSSSPKFDEDITVEVARAKRYKRPLTLILAEVDQLSNYIEFHGKEKGENLVEEIKKVLADNLRGVDTVYHYAGKFALILPETDKESAILVAGRLRKTVSETSFVGMTESQPQKKITISMGLAGLGDDADDTEALVKAAEKSLMK